MLGLSNLRSALQALQLRESMIRTNCFLRWLASDYDLGDALTKKRPDCRTGLLKYLKTKLWCVAFDPTFTAAKKNAKKGHTAVSATDGVRDSQPDFSFWGDATFYSWLSGCSPADVAASPKPWMREIGSDLGKIPVLLGTLRDCVEIGIVAKLLF